jgi:hypothetical protein
MRRARALAMLAALAPAAPTWGATVLLDGEGGSLTLGGYARTLAGLEKISIELAPEVPSNLVPNHFSLSTAVLRLEWKAALGDHFSAEIHDRLYLGLTSEALVVGGKKLGLGASIVPTRSVNLRSVIYDEDRLQFEHDIDRLALRASLGDFDITVGRQAITWGLSELFQVADLWTNFSPFELDTTQKRGIDALRVLYSQGRALEVEGVIADRGSVRDLSVGLRVASYGSGADFYFALAKQWREVLAFTGVSATAGAFKLRAEAAEPFNLDRSEYLAPRASVGADWRNANVTLTLEVHYNGTGVLRASEYVSHYQSSTALQHGESYLLGRWYAGAAAVWKISELYQLSLSALANLQDPSSVIAGAFTYQLTQGTELSLGGYQSIGKSPLIKAESELRSELGSAGGMVYLALVSFF